jgi:hypothetical protein
MLDRRALRVFADAGVKRQSKAIMAQRLTETRAICRNCFNRSASSNPLLPTPNTRTDSDHPMEGADELALGTEAASEADLRQ